METLRARVAELEKLKPAQLAERRIQAGRLQAGDVHTLLEATGSYERVSSRLLNEARLWLDSDQFTQKGGDGRPDYEEGQGTDVPPERLGGLIIAMAATGGAYSELLSRLEAMADPEMFRAAMLDESRQQDSTKINGNFIIALVCLQAIRHQWDYLLEAARRMSNA
jgi:hypothetical protein